MASSEMEIDSVLHALGPMGVFAVVQCSLFYLGYLTNAHHLFSFVFTGQFRYDLRYDLRHGNRSRTKYMDLTFIQGHTYHNHEKNKCLAIIKLSETIQAIPIKIASIFKLLHSSLA